MSRITVTTVGTNGVYTFIEENTGLLLPQRCSFIFVRVLRISINIFLSFRLRFGFISEIFATWKYVFLARTVSTNTPLPRLFLEIALSQKYAHCIRLILCFSGKRRWLLVIAPESSLFVSNARCQSSGGRKDDFAFWNLKTYIFKGRWLCKRKVLAEVNISLESSGGEGDNCPHSDNLNRGYFPWPFLIDRENCRSLAIRLLVGSKSISGFSYPNWRI